MEIGTIVSIIAICISGLSAFVTTYMTISYSIKRSKKDKRSIPSVAIWFDCLDDIDAQLDQNYRWFVNEKEVNEMVNNSYCYFCVNSDSLRIYNCAVSICETETDRDIRKSCTEEFKLGSLDIRNRKVIPIKIYENKMMFKLSIEYDTVEDEHFCYKVEFVYDAVKHNVPHRDDNLYIRKKKAKYPTEKIDGYKHLANYNNTISESYSGKEVKEWLKDRKLKK